MGLAFLLWILTAVVVCLTACGPWWFPSPISQHGAAFDRYFRVMLWITGLIFVAAQVLLSYAILRFRGQGRRAAYTPGNYKLELLWTSATAILFIGFSVAANGIWASVHFDSAARPDLIVDVLAKQFAWNFRYPGPDGKFGKTEAKFINDATGNPFGLDESDPAAKDDVISSTIRVPAGALVEVNLRSRDVIHNFFVRELRIKQDLVPGMTIPLRFRAEKPGEYEVPCSELCGLGHHQMRTVLIVMAPADFKRWLDEEGRKAR